MFRAIAVFGVSTLLAVLVFTETAEAQPGFMPGFISGIGISVKKNMKMKKRILMMP